MIRYFLLAVSICMLSIANMRASSMFKDELQGAWQHIEKSGGGDIQHIIMFCGNYFSWTTFSAVDGAFKSTKGGKYSFDGSQLAVEFEFDNLNPDMVGKQETWRCSQRLDIMVIGTSNAEFFEWKAIDQGTETELTGAWLFSGREKDGEITRRDNSTSPRKTMKMLTGTRFQWIAFNTETKEFFGTGGGAYEIKNGAYTEHIGFFSRDNKRVGAQLGFQANVQGPDWHHKGKSSAGEDMYEIWSRRQ
jgi:hypothetical protein